MSRCFFKWTANKYMKSWLASLIIKKLQIKAEFLWLTPIILAAWEAEIGRIEV
jgi:hypothetical protein